MFPAMFIVLSAGNILASESDYGTTPEDYGSVTWQHIQTQPLQVNTPKPKIENSTSVSPKDVEMIQNVAIRASVPMVSNQIRGTRKYCFVYGNCLAFLDCTMNDGQDDASIGIEQIEAKGNQIAYCNAKIKLEILNKGDMSLEVCSNKAEQCYTFREHVFDYWAPPVIVGLAPKSHLSPVAMLNCFIIFLFFQSG